jgi:hypothetical protein
VLDTKDFVDICLKREDITRGPQLALWGGIALASLLIAAIAALIVICRPERTTLVLVGGGTVLEWLAKHEPFMSQTPEKSPDDNYCAPVRHHSYTLKDAPIIVAEVGSHLGLAFLSESWHAVPGSNQHELGGPQYLAMVTGNENCDVQHPDDMVWRLRCTPTKQGDKIPTSKVLPLFGVELPARNGIKAIVAYPKGCGDRWREAHDRFGSASDTSITDLEGILRRCISEDRLCTIFTTGTSSGTSQILRNGFPAIGEILDRASLTGCLPIGERPEHSNVCWRDLREKWPGDVQLAVRAEDPSGATPPIVEYACSGNRKALERAGDHVRLEWWIGVGSDLLLDDVVKDCSKTSPYDTVSVPIATSKEPQSYLYGVRAECIGTADSAIAKPLDRTVFGLLRELARGLSEDEKKQCKDGLAKFAEYPSSHPFPCPTPGKPTMFECKRGQ